MMEKHYEILSNNSWPDACKVSVTDAAECFICRDGELTGQEELSQFCDCKSLVAHHHCLLTWITKGLGSEDRLRCTVCNAEYRLRRHAAWLSVATGWQTWPILAVAVALLGAVPYLVFRMMTAFQNPPPNTLFKVASVCFGFLTEALLIRCVWIFLCVRYRQAKHNSFRVLPREVAFKA